MAYIFDDIANIGLGIANAVNNQRNSDRSFALQQQQFELSKDSYYNGIQRKVEDAKKAGIHPLSALGMQGSSYSPIIQNDTVDNSLAELGQSVRQSADSILQSRMAKKEMTLLDKQIEQKNEEVRGMQLQNDMQELKFQGMLDYGVADYSSGFGLSSDPQGRLWPNLLNPTEQERVANAGIQQSVFDKFGIDYSMLKFMISFLGNYRAIMDKNPEKFMYGYDRNHPLGVYITRKGNTKAVGYGKLPPYESLASLDKLRDAGFKGAVIGSNSIGGLIDYLNKILDFVGGK